MCNVDAVPDFLSSFLSGRTVQGHLDLVETENIRDADNETDLFYVFIEIVTKPGYWKARALDAGSSRIWAPKTVVASFRGCIFPYFKVQESLMDRIKCKI